MKQVPIYKFTFNVELISGDIVIPANEETTLGLLDVTPYDAYVLAKSALADGATMTAMLLDETIVSTDTHTMQELDVILAATVDFYTKDDNANCIKYANLLVSGA